MPDVDFTDLKKREWDGSHLTREQVLYIEKYMRKILRKLDLNYWRVWVARDLPHEGCTLMIEPTDGRRVAMLYVSEGWWDDTPDHRTEMTHEALHLAHHDQEEVIRRFVRDTGDVGPYAMGLIWSQFKTETERMVDSLSYVLAPTMPKWSPPIARAPQTSDTPLTMTTPPLKREDALMVPPGAMTVKPEPPDGPAARALGYVLGALPNV